MFVCAVLGAGNGGQALAAVLSHMGHEVRVWDGVAEVVEALRKKAVIETFGALEIKARPDVISSSMGEAMEGVNMVFVVVPAHVHRKVAELAAPFLNASQIVVLNPGRTAGAMEFRQVLSCCGCDGLPAIAEAQSLLYTARLDSPGRVHLLAVKRSNLLACIVREQQPRVQEALAPIYCGLEFAPSTLCTGLGNIGAILHPAPVLLNTGWVESRDVFFSHYYSGISPSIAAFLERMDQERLSVARAYGVEVLSVKQWHERVYGHGGQDLLAALRENQEYASIDAPRSLQHRYLFEDIPTGLVPISELGRAAAVPTPCMNLVIELANILVGVDFRREGRSLERLGLAGRTVADITAAF